MRFRRPALAWIAFLPVMHAQSALPLPNVAAPAKPVVEAGSRLAFELIPKAFQFDPTLDMTVITELTEPGRKLPPISPQAPAYYVVHSAGYHVIGEPHGGKSLAAPEVDAILQRALAARGYLPAAAGHPPTLLIVYFWGAHNVLDQDNPALSDEQWTNNILERAALVGGEKFAAGLATAIQRSDAASSSSATHLTSRVATNEAGAALSDPMSNLGAAAAVAQMNALMNPVRLFKQRSAKNEFLVDQASADCYYVVASAYEYSSVATHAKQLLWRTRMTVNSRGVSQPQALPTLVASAAPYFGRDMAEAETLLKRAVPAGKVKIGTPTVVEPAPAETAAGKP